MIRPKRSFTGWEHLELCILTDLILRVTVSSLFRLINTFSAMFDSPGTRVLSSVTAITFFWVLFILQYRFRTHLLYYSQTLMCSVFSLGLLQATKSGPFEKILGSFTCYFDKGLHATCFQDSVINLWYLFILLFSYHCYRSQSI